MIIWIINIYCIIVFIYANYDFINNTIYSSGEHVSREKSDNN